MDTALAHIDSTIDARVEPRRIFRRRGMLALGSAPPIPVRTVDLSASGVGIMMNNPLPTGQMCALTVDIFGSRGMVQLRMKGKVVYCVLSGTEGFRSGMQFTELDATTKAIIGELVKQT